VNLQERHIDAAQVIVVTFVRVTNEQLTLGVVVFQPIFKGSSHEAASDNSNVNHFSIEIICIFFTKSPQRYTIFFICASARVQYFQKCAFSAKKSKTFNFQLSTFNFYLYLCTQIALKRLNTKNQR
jgi:hypothetical protein